MTKNSCRIHMLLQNVRYEKFTTVNMLTQQHFRPRTVSENRVIRNPSNLIIIIINELFNYSNPSAEAAFQGAVL